MAERPEEGLTSVRPTPDGPAAPPTGVRAWPSAVTRAPLTARTASVAGAVAGPVAAGLFVAAIVLRGALITLAFTAAAAVFGWLVLQASPALPRRPGAEVARVVFAFAAAPLTGIVYAPILFRAAGRWRPGTIPRPRPPVDRTRAAVVAGMGLTLFAVLIAVTLILPTGSAAPDQSADAGAVPTSAPTPVETFPTEPGVPGTAVEGTYASPSPSASFQQADGFTQATMSCGQQVLATVDGTISEVAEQPDGSVVVVLLGDDGLAHVYSQLLRVQPSGQQGLQVQAGNPIAVPSEPREGQAGCTFGFALSTPEAAAAGGYRTRIDATPFLQAWASGDAEASPVQEMRDATGGA